MGEGDPLSLDQEAPLQQWEAGDAPEEELDAAVAMAGGPDNQVGEAPLQDCGADVGPHVELLTFSRSPKAYRDVLLQSAGLAGYRHALEERSCAVELPSGAKVSLRGLPALPTLPE